MNATTRVRRSRAIIPALLMLMASCEGTELTSPDSAVAVDPAFGIVGAAIDLNGTWEWTETTVIQIRAWAVPLFFGIPAEGPITHIECQVNGTLQITQSGISFAGTSSQQGSCLTRRGTPVPAPFPPTLEMIDGTITGRSYRFTWDAGPFPTGGQIFCPYHGSVRVSGGKAVELRGSGDCLLPGEKEFGHDFTKHFRAVRN